MKKKIIMDIDSVGDDILAVFFMANNPDVDVLGITTVTGASGDIQQAAWVAQNTVDLTDNPIPVYAGAGKPIAPMAQDSGDAVNFFEEVRWKFGDRLDMFNTPAQKPKTDIMETYAVDFLVDTVRKNPGEITLITTGPLTNIALAIRKDPEFAKNVKEAYVLGGTFHVPGNISPVTEYNIAADAEASKIVLTSDMKITLVPLDICETNQYADAMLTRDHIADLVAGGNSPVIEFIAEKYPIYIDVWREFFKLSGFPMDDIITASLVTHEDLCTYSEPLHVDVETEGHLTRGQTIAFHGVQINRYPEREHKNVRIAETLQGRRFMDLFTEMILRGAKK